MRGRPFKREIFKLDLLRAYGDVAAQSSKTIPTDPELLSEIVQTLLTRMSRLNQKHANISEWLIRCIAGFEERRSLGDSSDLLGCRPRILWHLANAPIPRGKHWVPVLNVQKIKLSIYLEMTESEKINDPFPIDVENASLRRFWLQKHTNAILKLLDYPCGCSHRKTLQSITNKSNPRNVAHCITREQLIVRVLSEWHATGDHQIRKLLGPRFRK